MYIEIVNILQIANKKMNFLPKYQEFVSWVKNLKQNYIYYVCLCGKHLIISDQKQVYSVWCNITMHIIEIWQKRFKFISGE